LFISGSCNQYRYSTFTVGRHVKSCGGEGNLPFMLCYSEEVNEFVKDFYKSNLVYNFNWSEWQNEALNYFEKPELLKNVDIEIIRKLLTLHVRKERFCEGHLIDKIVKINNKKLLKVVESAKPAAPNG